MEGQARKMNGGKNLEDMEVVNREKHLSQKLMDCEIAGIQTLKDASAIRSVRMKPDHSSREIT